MSDPLRQLSEAGVAVWLDDLSRDRLRTGNLADLIRDRSVVGITTNPTIFQKAISRQRRLQPAAGRPRRPRRRRRRGLACHHHQRRPLRPATSCARRTTPATASTAGSRSRSTPGSPATTTKTIAEARALWWLVDRPNLFIKIPATLASLPAISQALAEGISVNVTLIFCLDRYDLVMDAFLEGIERAQKAGIDLSQDRLGRLVLRLPGRHRDRQAARQDRHDGGQGAARQGRRRQRPAGLPALRKHARGRPLEGAGGRRRQDPAAAVGLHRRQGPELPRHHVRRRPGRPRHGQHHAGSHPAGGVRPRRHRGRHHPRPLRRCAARARRPRGARRRLRRRRRHPGTRGRREVRGFLESAHRGRQPNSWGRRSDGCACSAGATRCAIRATAGCRACPTRARWSCSASPATWPARS